MYLFSERLDLGRSRCSLDKSGHARRRSRDDILCFSRTVIVYIAERERGISTVPQQMQDQIPKKARRTP